jgi:colanic acid/amylovoran biosynthesis glycosyltransferase
VRVAVLCSRYPAVSHTFIQREVQALRREGVEVETFAIRRARPDEVLSEADRAEWAATYPILPPRAADLLRAHGRALRRHPRAWLATLGRALALTPGTPRGTLWQLFYFAEAVVLWDRVRRRGIRHVHAHFADVASDVALLATTLGNRAYVGGWTWSLGFHGPAQLYGVREHRVPAKIDDAAFVACVSDYLRSQLMMFVDPREWPKLHLVRTAVDPSSYAPDGRPRSNTGRVLTVARLVRGKGVDVLLDALAVLDRRGVRPEAMLVGDGPERDRIARRAQELGLDERVALVGAVGQDEMRDHFAAADVFCLPSFSEGVPVVLMEAMAMQLPVVATRVTGVPELVEHGRSGVLVPPGRADALADALEKVLRAPIARRREMGAAGRERVTAEFTPDRSAKRLRKLFEAYST